VRLGVAANMATGTVLVKRLMTSTITVVLQAKALEIAQDNLKAGFHAQHTVNATLPFILSHLAG
jgi:hypothetical protein